MAVYASKFTICYYRWVSLSVIDGETHATLYACIEENIPTFVACHSRMSDYITVNCVHLLPNRKSETQLRFSRLSAKISYLMTVLASKAIIYCTLSYSCKEYCGFTICMIEFPSDLITDRGLHRSHSVTLLSISEKTVGNPSSLRVLSREIYAHLSVTIHYDRSSYKFERPALTVMHKLIGYHKINMTSLKSE